MKRKSPEQIIQQILAKSYSSSSQELRLTGQLAGLFWKRILQGSHFRNLKTLCLECCSLVDEDIQLLMGVDYSNLGLLSLANNYLTQNTILFISQSKRTYIKNLPELILDYNYIRLLGFKIISGLGFQKLKRLSLKSHGYGQDVLKEHYQKVKFNYESFVSQNFKMDGLQILDLQNQQIGSKQIKILLKCRMPLIQQVNLRCNQITDTTMKKLTKVHWPNLKILVLELNFLRFSGHESMILANWKNLMSLNIDQVSRGQSYSNQYCSGIETLNLVSIAASDSVKLHSFVLVNSHVSKDVYIVLYERGMVPFFNFDFFGGGGG